MAQASDFTVNALVTGILSTAENRREELFGLLEQHFGKIRKVSRNINFSFTDYYNKEMGEQPVRYVILFETPVDPSTLAEIKLLTNSLEKNFISASGGRQINIDPGLLSLSSFVLASCKNRSHRIALSGGVYAETTLIYQNGDFISLPWTYADWASEELKSVLREFRLDYRQMLKKTAAALQ